MRRATILLAALCLVGASAEAVAAAPPRLSADHSRVAIRSTYGSGVFGRWFVDSFGLTAYRYTLNQQTAAQAKQRELNGRNDAWHQVGNDHVIADAFNHEIGRASCRERV